MKIYEDFIVFKMWTFEMAIIFTYWNNFLLQQAVFKYPIFHTSFHTNTLLNIILFHSFHQEKKLDNDPMIYFPSL